MRRKEGWLANNEFKMIRGLIEILALHLTEGTEEFRENLQDSRCPGWDSNPVPSEYK
jgi:hypothetical protein